MADDFGLKIGLEGEKEFKKALSEINQSFKVLGSEMKLVSSQFDKNDQSVEALTARNTVLNKEIEAQKQKIETLKKALENAATSFGENDRRTQAWQIQLNNAEAALNDMERELQQNNDALDRAAGEFDDAEKQADDFGDEVEDAGKQSNDAGDKFEKLGAVCKAAGVAIATAFAAVSAAAVAAGKALVDMAVEGAAYADTVLTESTVTGIATDKLQEYMYAAELVDVSTETLTKSMAKQIKSMKSATDGSKTMVAAYDALGVSVTDANGNMRDSDTVYWELIDALGKVENETERDALAMTILGKSAQELNPLIEAGAQRMQELGEEARNAGYVLSEDMLAAYGALDDNLQYLKVNAEGAKNALGTVLLPVLTELSGTGVELLAEFTKGISDANGDIGKMSDWCAVSDDLFLIYKPYGNTEFYRKVRINYLTKTELTDTRWLSVPMSLACLTPWYRATPSKMTMSTEEGNVMQYPFSYASDLIYSSSNAGSMAVDLGTAGHIPAAFVLNYSGEIINPKITLKGSTTGQTYGVCALNITLAAGEQIEVSTQYGNSYAHKIDGSGKVSDILECVDLAYEPFPRIPVSEDCTLYLGADEIIRGSATVRVYYYYRSV